MKLSKQVCTPEQGIRLRELGVMVESVFCWVEDKAIPHFGKHLNEIAPAFTASELMEMMQCPAYVWKEMDDGDVLWNCGDSSDNAFHMMGFEMAETIAIELISSIEAKIISVESINKLT